MVFFIIAKTNFLSICKGGLLLDRILQFQSLLPQRFVILPKLNTLLKKSKYQPNNCNWTKNASEKIPHLVQLQILKL